MCSKFPVWCVIGNMVTKKWVNDDYDLVSSDGIIGGS